GRGQPGGPASGRAPLWGTLDDRGPLGRGAGAGPRPRGAHRGRARSGPPARDPCPAACTRQPAPGGLSLARGGPRVSPGRSAMPPAKGAQAGPPADKRRVILDAAVRVFARQGFHACRVADIAEEAGVAYGLVYHYFASKDEVLDTLFSERWNVMLEVI